jgi:hypothetical protein
MACLTPQYQIYIPVFTSISDACLFSTTSILPSPLSQAPGPINLATHLHPRTPSQSPLLCHMHIRRAVPHRSPSTGHESMNLLHHAARLRPTPKSMENSKSIKNKSRRAKVALAKINQSQYSCILPACSCVQIMKARATPYIPRTTLIASTNLPALLLSRHM